MENDWQRRVALILCPEAEVEEPKPKKSRTKKAKAKPKTTKRKSNKAKRGLVVATRDDVPANVKYGLKNLTNDRILVKDLGILFPGMTMELPASMIEDNSIINMVLSGRVAILVLEVEIKANEIPKKKMSLAKLPWDYDYDTEEEDVWDPTPAKKRAKRRGQLFDEEF